MELNLAHFTAEDLKEFLKDSEYEKEALVAIHKLYLLLSNYGLEKKLNVADLKLMSELLPYLNRPIADTEKRISDANEEGKNSQIYTFNTLKDAKVDDETIRKTDGINRGYTLLFNNPARFNDYKFYHINSMTVGEIKNLLGKFDLKSLDNAFETNVQNLEYSNTSRLVDAINRYDKQLARIYRETGNRGRGVDLLNVDRSEKREIVREKMREMTECLIDTGSEYVWGKLSDEDKFKLMKALNGSRSRESKTIYYYLLDMYTNYTTLNQLKNGVTKQKALKPFIVKYK